MRKCLVLATLLLMGGALRFAAIVTVGNVPSLHGDEPYYLGQAASLAQGTGYMGARRPPGFPVFLAAVSRIASGDLQSLRLAQMLVSLLAIAIVFDLISRRFSLAAAAISGLFVAASPDLVHVSHFLWSECFLTSLLLLTVWLLDRARESRHVAIVILAAVASAAAAMTREMALYLVPLFGVWLAWEECWRWRRAAVFIAVAVICITPWTIRNTFHFGQLVLISTNRWYPMADGNLALVEFPVKRIREMRHQYNTNADEIGREVEAREIALAAIRERQPWWIFEKLALNSYTLFAPMRTQLGRFVDEGWLPARWAGLARALLPFEALVYSLGIVLGIVGLWLVPDPTLKRLALAVLGVFIAIYIVGNATNRFRVPMIPFVLLYTGPLLVGRFSRARWRIIGASLTVGGFLVAASVDLFCPPDIRIRQYAANHVVRPGCVAQESLSVCRGAQNHV